MYEPFLPPAEPGQMYSLPSAVGTNSGLTIGRPFSSSPLDQLSLSTYCTPCRYLPVVRSSTYRYPLRLGCASALTTLPLRCTGTRNRSVLPS